MSNKLNRLVAAGTLLLAFTSLQMPPALHAQAVSVARITGSVTDEQGGSVSGAQLRLTGVATGAVYNVQTNADGIYTIPNLRSAPTRCKPASRASRPTCRPASSCTSATTSRSTSP